MKINIVKYDGLDMEFDIIGIHTALANAFRRILLSEVSDGIIFFIMLMYSF